MLTPDEPTNLFISMGVFPSKSGLDPTINKQGCIYPGSTLVSRQRRVGAPGCPIAGVRAGKWWVCF